MLKFLGIGSAFNEEMGNTAAYIKENDTLILLDCGSTAFGRIMQMGLLEDVENVYIAITHFHQDHAGSVGTLVQYLSILRGIVPNFILTNGENAEVQEQELRSYLTKVGVTEDEYDFSYGDMIEDVIPGLQKIEMVQVKHSKQLTSYAVELYFEDKTIYYTGDQNDVEYVSAIARKLKPNDLVYTDCTAKEYKGRVHISLNELAEIFAEEQREQVCCMHFENFRCYTEAKEMGFKVANREFSKDELLRRIAGRK
ncbi:MAG: MBL fold metallo-hydrolase [Clostridiales bacterium]|nr:MBL fold metallo-hydrolase [Clostridiales bacterium]